MIKSVGTIVVEPNFMFLDCEDDIANLYRWFSLRNGIILIKQRHNSHISVIRQEEITTSLDKKFLGRRVEFSYNPEYIQKNKSHYWFRIISPELEYIRETLGFSNQPFEIIDGKIITHPFHLTIGRIKK